MINMLKNLHKEESGQDLIEYALIGLIDCSGRHRWSWAPWLARSTTSSPRSLAS